MRPLLFALTVAIVAFWLTMNSLLVVRELSHRRSGQYQSGIDRFLGTSYRRERWMSIYSGAKKTGFTGHAVEKVLAIEGTEYQITVETLHRGKLPMPSLLSRLLTDSNLVRLSGRLVLDEEMLPRSLFLSVDLILLEGTSLARQMDVLLVGKRVDERFEVEVIQDEDSILRVRLPLEKLALSNGLTPTLPLAEYEVGKSYRVAVFDPLASLGLGDEEAVVRVLSRTERRVDGLEVDVFEVETSYRKSTTRAWVTPGGETLRQELGPPFDLTLRLESTEARARRGFEDLARPLPEEPGE